MRGSGWGASSRLFDNRRVVAYRGWDKTFSYKNESMHKKENVRAGPTVDVRRSIPTSSASRMRARPRGCTPRRPPARSRARPRFGPRFPRGPAPTPKPARRTRAPPRAASATRFRRTRARSARETRRRTRRRARAPARGGVHLAEPSAVHVQAEAERSVGGGPVSRGVGVEARELRQEVGRDGGALRRHLLRRQSFKSCFDLRSRRFLTRRQRGVLLRGRRHGRGSARATPEGCPASESGRTAPGWPRVGRRDEGEGAEQRHRAEHSLVACLRRAVRDATCGAAERRQPRGAGDDECCIGIFDTM